MKYTIVWSVGAERELARLWLDTAVRDAITQAAYAIESALTVEPSEVGESRPPGRRIFISTPLAVVFEVFEADRIVRILELWRFQKRLR
jgi:plasmid stabilization system protein ParE